MLNFYQHFKRTADSLNGASRKIPCQIVLYFRFKFRDCFENKRGNSSCFGPQRIGIVCSSNCYWNGKLFTDNIIYNFMFITVSYFT